jgi:hypothetical protein
MPIRFQLGEADAAKYKAGDEWFVYDVAKLRDMPADELIELESHLSGYSLTQLEADFFGRSGALGRKGLLYVARRLAGVVEAWENFNPRLNAVLTERVAAETLSADADDAEDEAPDPTGPATLPES